MKATAKDLRFHASEILATVSRGEEVVITYRGKPCAKLVPIRAGETEATTGGNELFRIWADYDEMEDVEGYVRRLRTGRF